MADAVNGSSRMFDISSMTIAAISNEPTCWSGYAAADAATPPQPAALLQIGTVRNRSTGMAAKLARR